MRRRKIRTSFAFPAELDMAPYLDTNGGGGAPSLYDLCAITVHKGTAMGGHYIAFGRSDVGIAAASPPLPSAVVVADGDDNAAATSGTQRDSNWVCFNDANVHVLSRAEADNLFKAEGGQSGGTTVSDGGGGAATADTETGGATTPAAPLSAGAADGSTAAANMGAPLPSAKQQQDATKESTFGVDKDAYLLVYRRRDEQVLNAGVDQDELHQPTPAAGVCAQRVVVVVADRW